MFLSIFLIVALFFGANPAFSQSASETASANDKEKVKENKHDAAFNEGTQSKTVVTRHRVVVNGVEINYAVTAGQLPVMNEAGQTEADVFFIAYSVEGKSDVENGRPLMFIFNGGPGAASVWLHLGAVGPRRVQMLANGSMPSPPFVLVDNEYTWLDKADLVFIDPVGTGYSRAVKPDLTKKFTSVQGDIDSLERFIRLYLTRYERWSSPLFLVGESYGTFRAAGLSEHLIEHGIALNGVIMISSVMNLQTISFDTGNDLPYVLCLPSYAATAWYHKMSPIKKDLGKILEEAETWAATDYLTALGKGDLLSHEERQAVVEKLAGFTGLEKTFIDNRNLRIDVRTFAEELLRKRKQMTGLMDSRYTAQSFRDPAPPGFDLTIEKVRSPFTATFNDYVRRELGYRSDLEYYTLGGGIEHWDWESRNRYADTVDNLRNTIIKNPYMKVFIASGYFDLSTPYFATEYSLAHLGLPPTLRENIVTRRYSSGHMMYLDAEAIRQLKKDVMRFIDGALLRNRRGG